jgi:hypothetical protein
MAAQMAPLSEHERKTLVRLLNKLARPTIGVAHRVRAAIHAVGSLS